MSSIVTSEAKPAAPATPPLIEKIKVKVDGREIAGPPGKMKIAVSSQH